MSEDVLEDGNETPTGIPLTLRGFSALAILGVILDVARSHASRTSRVWEALFSIAVTAVFLIYLLRGSKRVWGLTVFLVAGHLVVLVSSLPWPWPNGAWASAGSDVLALALLMSRSTREYCRVGTPGG